MTLLKFLLLKQCRRTGDFGQPIALTDYHYRGDRLLRSAFAGSNRRVLRSGGGGRHNAKQDGARCEEQRLNTHEGGLRFNE